MGIIRYLANMVIDAASMVASERPRMTAPPPAPPEESKPLPDGWPPFYGRRMLDDGRFVITVKCAVTGRVASTSFPRWTNEEDCREDAWHRHADDPAPELAYDADGNEV